MLPLGCYGGRDRMRLRDGEKGDGKRSFVQLYAGPGGGCPRRGGSVPSQTENNSLLALINIENGRPHVRNVARLPFPCTLTLLLQPLRIHSSSLPFALFRLATFFQPYLFAALLSRFALSSDFSPRFSPLFLLFFFIDTVVCDWV